MDEGGPALGFLVGERRHPVTVAGALLSGLSRGAQPRSAEFTCRNRVEPLPLTVSLQPVPTRRCVPTPAFSDGNGGAPVSPLLPAARDDQLDTGNTAWMLASAALVLLMTPGLAFFYGGMVRSKSVLNMLMMNFICIAIVGVLWALYGFSLAFGRPQSVTA